ncbi:inovirus-type Gp2 protein [Caballeronia sp. LZ062]|uniref:inovirus-type Gp2 protein n=1 Tax=unclassified Caballeronia TaxID=2646786 RepID=UPI00285BE078|nr:MULTISPECIES: inovirus-type Gp2 protein [unclassified Caballeronia]MDR5855985.1 inovirus-type Gp2 protein [Caballeronia sp. LZ050]MDR5872229.1 inovirus-type Gp2 protein [Caballeronia sp. LZ062]
MHEITEDQEALEVIAHLDERMNLEETNINGRSTFVIHQGYGSRHLFGIEKFVKAIQRGWKGGFIEKTARYSGRKTIHELYLGKKYYRLLNDWIERYSDQYRYSARVEVFYSVCKAMGLIGQQNFHFEEPGEIARADGARSMDAFNMLIAEISMRCESREFKEEERLRQFNTKRNEENVLAMEEEMFEAKGRWLVLSLTLRYKPKYRRWITPETMQQHRDRLFAARRFNKLMAGIRNYVWAIEQGHDTGLHLHVILFYSGEHNHDEFIAKQIGEYWVDVVTEGKGDYWNSNRAWLKKRYEKFGHGIGVGQIDWSDTKKREALRKNLVYLAKAEQYLMSWSVERIRTFDMGQVPKKLKSGRPRAELQQQESEVGESHQFIGGRKDEQPPC